MAEVLDELGYPREVTKEEVVSAFLQTIQRPLNCLSAEEQQLRRNAIEKLHMCLLKDDAAGSLPPMDVLQEAWDEVILEKVLRCVCDPSERCRELAIRLILEVAQSLTEVDCTLKKTVGVMEERMGQIPVLEGSEEIRLQLFSLLIDALLPECEIHTLQNLIDPLHRIVAVTLFDQFHEVQKKACSVLVTLASRDPDVFGNKTGVFLRGLVPCLNHAHSRVRIAVFQAIDSMMQCGLTKSLVAQQLAPGTKSLAFDHNVAVRELFFSSVGNWLNFKSNMMEDEEIHQCVVSGKIPRFHLPELLPLLLLGITDDFIDIATLTYERLEGIGEVYKKFMDHLDTRATHGPGGQRFRTTEEDARLMEKVMEGERKCQEKYERDLREAEEQRRVQREREAGCSTSEDTTTQDAPASQETSLYQSLKAQTDAMEEELNRAVLSTEKVLGNDLGLSDGPDLEQLEFCEDSPQDQQRLQAVSGAGNSDSTDTTSQEDERTLTPSRKQKDTSEITDEGAVKKLDTSEAGVETLQLPKPWNGRANAGCRLMVEAFLRPMIEPALKELKHWKTRTRLCAARFLHTLMVLAEGLAKDNFDILIPAFFRAVGDDNVKVAKRAGATIHIIGFHVPPRKWLPSVLKPLDATKASQEQRANVLAVAAAFLHGTPRKALEEKHVVWICGKLFEKELFCSSHSAVQNQLLFVVENLIQVAGALCKSSSFKIFVLLLRLQSAEGDAELQKRPRQAQDALAQALGMESTRELQVLHIQSFLDIVTTGCEGWSSSLPGKFVFLNFIRSSMDIVGPHLKSLMPLFGICLQIDQDPTLHISFLQLLDELFEKQELESSWAPLAHDVLSKLLIPCASGHASKTEAAGQFSAMVAIGTFLKRDLCSQELIQELLTTRDSGVLSALRTCTDEKYSHGVRSASAHVIHELLRIAGSILNDEERKELIEALTNCVMDGSNFLRRLILPSVAIFFTTMPPNFSDSKVRLFLHELVMCMDEEENPLTQEDFCTAMEPCAMKKPEIVMEVVSDVVNYHMRHWRNHEHINRVLNVVRQHAHRKDILTWPDQTFTMSEAPLH